MVDTQTKEQIEIWNREDWAFGDDESKEWFKDVVYKVKLREIPQGEFFILKLPPLVKGFNKFPPIFSREYFNQSDKKYYCEPATAYPTNPYKEKYLDGDTTVYIGFTF